MRLTLNQPHSRNLGIEPSKCFEQAEELLKHFKLDSDTAPRDLLRAKKNRDYSQDRQDWPMAKLQVMIVAY